MISEPDSDMPAQLSDCDHGLSVRPLMGIGVLRGIAEDGAGRLLALDIAAFKTRLYGGLIPHAKHGGSGVCSGGVAGSKLEGTGFEKEQIGHIQVASRVGVGFAAGRWKGLSVRSDGDEVALREGVLRLVTVRFCIEERLLGFGTRVILADDFKKPACRE